MSNIFLFTGEERYLLDQELQRRKDGFVQKFGEDAVFVYGPENFEPAEIIQNCMGWWLFVSKKMIIIKHVPTDGFHKISAKAQEAFVDAYTKQAANISPDTIVLFVSYKPDKRVKFYKYLQKNAQIKEFNTLRDSQRKTYIKTRSKDTQRESDVLDYFLLQVGSDMYRLQSEREKLSVWTQVHNKTTITKKDIDTVVFGQVQPNTFALFDYLFTDIDKALVLIDQMRDDWSNRNEAIGAMYRGIILFIMMVDSHKQGVHDPRSISKRIGYAPFAVSKQYGRIQTFVRQEQNLKNIYQWLITIDESIKTGKLPAEAFWIRSKDLFYHYASWKKPS